MNGAARISGPAVDGAGLIPRIETVRLILRAPRAERAAQ